jgi:hypothetical protein
VTGDMTAWLRAQVEADKAAAELAAREGSQWKQDDPQHYPGAISSLGGPVVYDEGAPDEHQAAHIVIHDPRDKIADCDAKLRLLDEYEARENDVVLMLGPECERQRQWSGLRLAVRLLASGYRHRDGWQEGWSA